MEEIYNYPKPKAYHCWARKHEQISETVKRLIEQARKDDLFPRTMTFHFEGELNGWDIVLWAA